MNADTVLEWLKWLSRNLYLFILHQKGLGFKAVAVYEIAV